MIIQDAINEAVAVTGQVVPAATLVRWLSEFDGRIAFEFFKADSWEPYDPGDPSATPPDEGDLGCELLVPFPWDGVYIHELEAMTYYTNGEYDRYQNALTMGEKVLDDFRKYLQRTHLPVCEALLNGKTGGSGVTIVTGCGGGPWFYLSAYAEAVKHGFEGTPEEWLDSLVGPKGDPGDTALASITVTPPTKRYYASLSEALDLTGMSVDASFSNGVSYTLLPVLYTASPANGSSFEEAGMATVTVTYRELGVTKTDSFDVSVMAGPIITAEPVDYTGPVGDTAIFTVVAQGDDLTYQWQFRDAGENWKNSSTNKTAKATAAILADRDGRQYRCVITDADNNTVTSEAATIHVASGG